MSSFVKKFKNIALGNNSHPSDSEVVSLLQEQLSIAECTKSCDSLACDDGSPDQSLWPQFKDIDMSSPLYNSSKPSTIQFLIPTNKSNWKHDAIKDEFSLDSVPRELDLLLKDFEGKFGVNVVDQPIGKDIFDKNVMSFKKLEKLHVLPFFITFENVILEELESMLDIAIPLLLNTNGIHTRSELIEKLKTLLKNLSVTVSPLDLSNLLLLCSHKNRDKRCFITAPIMKKELFKDIEAFNKLESKNQIGKTDVWFINHIGGHKFQANLQIYLNFKNDEKNDNSESSEDGNLFIWLARVGPSHCKEIVEHLLVKKGDKKADRKLLLTDKVRCGKRFEW
ncbi:hypothetical protein QEN19_004093 [Hanseniaspora menglaensis]